MMKKIMQYINEEIERVNQELARISIEPIEIRGDLQNLLLGSSKRIRSIVTILFLKANNVTVSDLHIKIMAVGEIIHNASLLHDDVLDGEDYRRGIPTVSKLYSPNVAVLTGDYMLSIATKFLLDIDDKYVSETFLNCIQEMCKAEIKQLFSRGKKLSIEEYLKICEGKTAYLFIAVMKSCLYKYISEKEIVDFAKNFGVLFQLQNDMKESSINADIRNKIFTAKDILSVEKTSILMDNYNKRVLESIKNLPNNIYRDCLEDLLKYYE